MVQRITIRYDDQPWEGLVTEIEHPVHFMYHILFEDGYENIFFTDPETDRWIEQDIGESQVAQLVGEELTRMMPASQKRGCLAINWFYGSFQEKLVHFGYHRYNLDEFIVFEIFAPNKRFLYTLVKLKKDHWKVFRLANAEWSGDSCLDSDLPYILEKYVLSCKPGNLY